LLLHEIQRVAIQVADGELARTVEGVVQVLHEVDRLPLAGKSSFDLPGFQELIDIVDVVGVKPQAHVVLTAPAVHIDQDLGVSKGHDAESY
jgi:hypothetical protein